MKRVTEAPGVSRLVLHVNHRDLMYSELVYSNEKRAGHHLLHPSFLSLKSRSKAVNVPRMTKMKPVERLKHARVWILVLDLDRRRLLDIIEADV